MADLQWYAVIWHNWYILWVIRQICDIRNLERLYLVVSSFESPNRQNSPGHRDRQTCKSVAIKSYSCRQRNNVIHTYVRHQRRSAVIKQQASRGRRGGGGAGSGLSWWPLTFSISLSISCVITGAFDGLLMMLRPSPVRPLCVPRCKRMGQQFPLLTPIPTSHKWTLSSPVTPVVFSQQN